MNDFSLALLGDGTFARWGRDCPQLQAELCRQYTRSTFALTNHGLEGARVGNVLARIAGDYPKDGQTVRHVAAENPDIVLVESCAYSQFWDGPEGLSEYRDLLRRVWEEIERTTTSKRLFCIAAPPPRDRFLEGAPLFVHTSKGARARFADGVTMFLDEARVIAQDEGWPVADAGLELQKLLAEGASPRRFIDQNEGVYPSSLGYEVAARAIVRALDNQRFIEEKLNR